MRFRDAWPAQIALLTLYTLLQFCEEFKEKCPFCVQCGLQLSERTQNPIIRHFGLQILEHVIK